MKKWLTLALLFSTVSTSASAAEASTPTPIQILMNDNRIQTEVNPQIVGGHTFVPLRAVAEGMGFQVAWNGEQRKVTLDQSNQHIEFTIGRPEVQVNGQQKLLDNAPYIVDGSTMLPVRFLGEQLGLEVRWDAVANAVNLYKPSFTRLTNLSSPIEHIVVVVEENHSYKQIIGSPKAPYMQSLLENGALFTNAHGVAHPSQPNYLTLFSGSSQGVTDDSCKKPFGTANLASELLDAGLTFTGYSEDLPKTGYTGCSYKGYARKHNPWVQFTNVPGELNRPFSDFPQDFSKLPTVSFVIPNHQNDMHDGTVQEADDWLKTNLDSYLTWAASHNSLLIITWDEDDNTKENRIPLIMAGPMVKPGQYDENVNHIHVLRTLEEAYHLPPLGESRSVNPITSVWK